MCRRVEKSQSTSGNGFLYQIITVKQYLTLGKIWQTKVSHVEITPSAHVWVLYAINESKATCVPYIVAPHFSFMVC